MIKLSKDEIIKTLEQCLLNVSCQCEQVGCYLADQHDCREQLFDNVVAMLKEQRRKVEDLTGFINGFSKNAVPVVRCGECRFSVSCSIRTFAIATNDDDWFCADGKRRDESK